MVFKTQITFESLSLIMAYGPKIHGLTQSSDELEELVEQV